MISWKLVLGSALLAGGLAGTASAATFSSLVTFGTSLSDPGNAAALTAIDGGGAFLPPTPYYFAGRFSNGPTAAEYLAQGYGVTVGLGWPTASAASNNFAVGGALNGNGNYNFIIDSPAGLNAGYAAVGTTGIAQQIARYAPFSGSLADPNVAGHTLFLLEGGPNDLFLGFETKPPSEISNVVNAALTDMAGDIGALAALGAKHILVPGLPDLGKTPEAFGFGPVVAGQLSQISAGYNAGLSGVLSQLGVALAPYGTQLYSFDTASFFDSVAGSAAQFGFDPDKLTQSCLYNGGLAALQSGCVGYLYFDKVHPTTQAHALWAEGLAAAVPEPTTYALMLLGLIAVGTASRRRA